MSKAEKEECDYSPLQWRNSSTNSTNSTELGTGTGSGSGSRVLLSSTSWGSASGLRALAWSLGTNSGGSDSDQVRSLERVCISSHPFLWWYVFFKGDLALGKAVMENQKQFFEALKKEYDFYYSEICGAGSRDSPYLAKYYGIFDDFLVMEYPGVDSLRCFIKGHGSLSVRVILNWAIDLAKALHYLHSNGIVHANVCPENILIRANFSVALGGFHAACKEGSQNNTSQRLGPANYIAPENCNGSAFNWKSSNDIYSLGILLLELLNKEKCTNISPEKLDDFCIGMATYKSLKLGDLFFKEMEKFADIIKACIAVNSKERPTAESLILKFTKLVPAKTEVNVIEPEQDIKHVASWGSYIQSTAVNNMVFMPPVQTKYLWTDDGIYGVPRGKATMPCRIVLIPEAEWFVIYAHGNACDLSSFPAKVLQEWAWQFKANILVFEFTGYGLYGGKPQEYEIVEDALYAYRFICDTIGWPAKKIVLYGHSVGTGVVLSAASVLATKKHGYQAPIILASAFPGISALAPPGVSWAVVERFPNVNSVKKVKGPILFLHGEKDDIFPPKFSVGLHENCKSEAFKKILHILPDEKHNFRYNVIEAYIEEFLCTFNIRGEVPQIESVAKKLEPYLPRDTWKPTRSFSGARVTLRKAIAASVWASAYVKASGKIHEQTADESMISMSDPTKRGEIIAEQLESTLKKLPTLLHYLGISGERSYLIDKELVESLLYYCNVLPSVFSEFRELKHSMIIDGTISKSLYGMRSAGYGTHHAQLRVGMFVCSWDQASDPRAKEWPMWKPDLKQVIQIPYLLHKWPGNVSGEMGAIAGALKASKGAHQQDIDSFKQKVAKYIAESSDGIAYSALAETCTSMMLNSVYSMLTNNCQDFYDAAVASLKVSTIYSPAMQAHINQLSNGPQFLVPQDIKGETVRAFVTSTNIRDWMTAMPDLVLLVSRWWITNLLEKGLQNQIGEDIAQAVLTKQLLQIHLEAYGKVISLQKKPEKLFL